MSSDELEGLKKAILEYDADAAVALTQECVDGGMDPQAIMDAMTAAIREVGDGYGQGELFLPDLVGAANALEKASPIVTAALKQAGAKRDSLGKVVIGTVAGDIHTIGKSMVISLMTAEGFEVVDLGTNVATDRFVDAVKEEEPAILAMSALLSTTAPESKRVVEELTKLGLREQVKIMVGGGAINEQFAQAIGADGYEPTAPEAAALAHKLLKV